ncbi:MAG: CHAT domain-containing protein [Saprospiraceae bacterium]|nr:CHAT domain-containing protein [Saprospiraceae bacterium]
MRVSLLICICLLTSGLPAQGSPSMALARSLSENLQFQASNEVLSDYIARYPNRLYDRATAFFLQSYNYMQLGVYHQAMVANKESLAIKERLGLEGAGENYMRSGAIYLLAGDPDRALTDLMRAKDFPIESGEVYALIDGYLGATYAELGELGEAEKYYQQSIESLEIDFGDEHPDLATAYYNLGRLKLKQDKLEDAEGLLRRAISIAAALRQHRTMGQIYNVLAKVQETTAPDEAYRTYEKAISLLGRQYGKHHADLARTHLNLSRYYLLEEEPDKARTQLGEALASLLPEEEVKSWKYMPRADVLSLDPVLLIQVLGQRTHLLQLMYREQPSSSHLRLALQSTEVATEVLALHLASLGGEVGRLMLTEKLYDIFEPGIRAAVELYEDEGEESYLEKAFVLTERGKAMMAKADDSAVDILQQKADLELGLRQALRAAQRNFEGEASAEAIAQLQEARKNLRLYQKELKGFQYLQTDGFGIADLQKSLAEDEAMLSYFLGEANYYIFALSREEVVVKQLANNHTHVWGKKKTLKKLMNPASLEPKTGIGVYSKIDPKLRLPGIKRSIIAYRRAIKKLDGSEYTFYAADLFGKLIYPVETVLRQKRKLLIIPHGDLFTIPFEAFLTAAPKEGKIKYKKYEYLIEDFSIRYASAAMDALTKESSTADYTYDFLGIAPIFSKEADQQNLAQVPEKLLRAIEGDEEMKGLVIDRQRFRVLPFSKEEVQQIDNLFAKAGRQSQVLLHTDASEASFKQSASMARFLHLATHSFSHAGDPLRSGIAFAQPDPEDAKEDGILYLSEISGLSIQPELVVLSSCEGNSGPLLKGEGIASLARAFTQAGSPRTVSALWSVYDTYTNTLMQAFYAALLKGQSYQEALRSAKLQLLKGKKIAPRMWSGFVLYGQG